MQCGPCKGCARDVVNQCNAALPDSQYSASQPRCGRQPMEFSTTLTTSYLANGVSAALTTPSARLPCKATFDSVSPFYPAPPSSPPTSRPKRICMIRSTSATGSAARDATQLTSSHRARSRAWRVWRRPAPATRRKPSSQRPLPSASTPTARIFGSDQSFGHRNGGAAQASCGARPAARSAHTWPQGSALRTGGAGYGCSAASRCEEDRLHHRAKALGQKRCRCLLAPLSALLTSPATLLFCQSLDFLNENGYH